MTDLFLIIGAALCPLALFFLLIWFLWSLFIAIKYEIIRFKSVDSIPCYSCIYYTGYQELKCTVHPHKAFTQHANNCLDFESTNLANKSSSNVGKSKLKWVMSKFTSSFIVKDY